jgi:hypothetical protein
MNLRTKLEALIATLIETEFAEHEDYPWSVVTSATRTELSTPVVIVEATGSSPTVPGMQMQTFTLDVHVDTDPGQEDDAGGIVAGRVEHALSLRGSAPLHSDDEIVMYHITPEGSSYSTDDNRMRTTGSFSIVCDHAPDSL